MNLCFNLFLFTVHRSPTESKDGKTNLTFSLELNILMLLADMLHAVDDALNTQLVLLFGANQGQTVNTLFISLSTKEQN